MLPAPSGPFSVGRATYALVDLSRPEPLAHRQQAHRELMVDVWYPAESNSKAKPASYIPDLPTFEKVMGPAELKETFGSLSPIILSLQTHAVENAPFARSVKFAPLLVFSHGGSVFRAHYATQFEDLASHGYVVVSIGHTFDTAITVFTDGRVVRLSNEGAPSSGASDEEIIRHQK